MHSQKNIKSNLIRYLWREEFCSGHINYFLSWKWWYSSTIVVLNWLLEFLQHRLAGSLCLDNWKLGNICPLSWIWQREPVKSFSFQEEKGKRHIYKVWQSEELVCLRNWSGYSEKRDFFVQELLFRTGWKWILNLLSVSASLLS